MAITQQELGKRIRAAREANRMTQDDVAKHLAVSRPTVGQIEAGNRTISSLELDKLAYHFGRDIREFIADSFQEEDALTALFRSQSDVVNQPVVMEKLRECIAFAPLLPGHTLGLSATLFDGRVMLGFRADATLVADLPLLADAVAASFDELRRLSSRSVHPARKRADQSRVRNFGAEA